MSDKKKNHLAATEMSVEGNYNQIDGIINNTPKPSVIDKMKDYEKRAAEHQKTTERRRKDNEVDDDALPERPTR